MESSNFWQKGHVDYQYTLIRSQKWPHLGVSQSTQYKCNGTHITHFFFHIGGRGGGANSVSSKPLRVSSEFTCFEMNQTLMYCKLFLFIREVSRSTSHNTMASCNKQWAIKASLMSSASYVGMQDIHLASGCHLLVCLCFVRLVIHC